MKINYKEVIQKEQTKLFRKYGVFFAFSNEQFNEQKKEGVKYVSLGIGMICPKDNVKDFLDAHKKLCSNVFKKELAQDGKEALIKRELENFECYYTGDCSDAIESLSDYGITSDEVLQVFNKGYLKEVV